ncbi:hypothetical protein [Stenotrophomonas phage BUCTxx99]|nr:hypothetical protein [Stenotrophomonas phage BUCTxx99]
MEHMELIDQAGIKLDAISLKLIQDEYPLDASRGGCNTVFHHCEIYQGRPSYASCLTVIDQAMEGKNFDLRPECHKAVADRTCPALAMRKAELQAGRALFFVDYRDVVRERKRLADEAEPDILFGRRSKEAVPRGKFVPTVFDAKGQPIFDKQKAAEVEIHIQEGPDNSKFKKPQKSKPKIERVGDGDVSIMQRVLEKKLNEG